MKTRQVLFLIAFIFLVGNVYAQQIKISNLESNRKGVDLTIDRNKGKLSEFPLTARGFLWDTGDSKTKAWRPQGVTGMQQDGKEFVVVSWYGRKEYMDPKRGMFDKNGMSLKEQRTDIPSILTISKTEGYKYSYQNRGARLSIIDLASYNYRHVLLVDKNMKTYPDMHAGGIAIVGNKIHVADSRSKHRVVRVYDLNKIEKQAAGKEIYKYSHVLVEEYNYKAPIKPSFIAYDNSRGEIVMGVFAKKYSESVPNTFVSFKPPQNKAEGEKLAQRMSEGKLKVYRIPDVAPNKKRINKLQGLVTTKGKGNDLTLCLSTSY